MNKIFIAFMLVSSFAFSQESFFSILEKHKISSFRSLPEENYGTLKIDPIKKVGIISNGTELLGTFTIVQENSPRKYGRFLNYSFDLLSNKGTYTFYFIFHDGLLFMDIDPITNTNQDNLLIPVLN